MSTPPAGNAGQRRPKDATRAPARRLQPDQPGARPEERGAFGRLRDRLHAWREAIRASPRKHRIYKITVGIIGGAVVLGGLALVPLPGPGWVIVFVGLAILASEFESANRLQEFVRRHVHNWTEWMGRQNLVVRVLVAMATFTFVALVVYGIVLLTEVPGWVPRSWWSWVPGLDG